MAKNIEIKARLDNPEQVKQRAYELADTDGELIKQHDIFFNCSTGRLKLRIFSENHGELIFYTRGNQTGPKSSNYQISATAQPHELKSVLDQAYGIRGEVKKNRILLMSGRTRIHLDQVEQLGEFLELEVVMNSTELEQTAIAEADYLMQQLGIANKDLIDCAYIDLLEQQ